MEPANKTPFDLCNVPEAFRPLIEAKAGSAGFPRALARFVFSLGKRLPASLAADLALKARDAAPEDLVVRYQTDPAIRRRIPGWHFRMLNDERRNAVFDNAIRSAVRGTSLVLELGSGAGLLAMMAARAGARHVYAVEIEPTLAEVSRRVVRANGLDDRITVLAGDGGALVLGKDIPERCDVLIHAMLPEGQLSSNHFATLSYARNELLTADAMLLPERARLDAALVHDPTLEARSRVEHVSGFDLREMNILDRDLLWPRGPRPELRRLSETAPLLDYAYSDDLSSLSSQREVELCANRSGCVSGILCWMVLLFPDGSVFEASPEHYSYRVQKFHTLVGRIDVHPGDMVRLVVENSVDELWIDQARVQRTVRNDEA